MGCGVDLQNWKDEEKRSLTHSLTHTFPNFVTQIYVTKMYVKMEKEKMRFIDDHMYVI